MFMFTKKDDLSLFSLEISLLFMFIVSFGFWVRPSNTWNLIFGSEWSLLVGFRGLTCHSGIKVGSTAYKHLTHCLSLEINTVLYCTAYCIILNILENFLQVLKSLFATVFSAWNDEDSSLGYSWVPLFVHFLKEGEFLGECQIIFFLEMRQ